MGEGQQVPELIEEDVPQDDEIGTILHHILIRLCEVATFENTLTRPPPDCQSEAE
jgi:hypothetical protein